MQPVTPRQAIIAVVWFLGLIVLTIIVAEAVLVGLGKPTLPGSIETLAATAAGGLIGLLASTRTAPAEAKADDPPAEVFPGKAP